VTGALGTLAKLLVGIVAFVGVALLGWGVTDLWGFVGHPARCGYVLLAILLQALVVIGWPAVGRTGGRAAQTVRRQSVAVLLLQILSIAIVFVAPYSDRREIAVLGASAILRYLGLGLFGFGFVLMTWAQLCLGRQFSVQVALQDGHRLVSDGLYRYLRHPRYLGIIVLNLGITLAFRSGLALMCTAGLVGVLLWRIHDEETLLCRAFGDEWQQYTRRSWRLMPFVY